MNNFSRVSGALRYIDEHLEEEVNLEMLSEKFSFSPYYFHRIFSAVVGKPLAAYIRDRRILYACIQLCGTEKTLLDIALDSGFHSPQAFSRAFKELQGVTPSEYRKQGYRPVIISADELIMKFTNRLNGGIFLKPNMIRRDAIIIAGAKGDGSRTQEVWSTFEKLCREKPLKNKLSGSGYEIQICGDGVCTVYAGICVSSREDIDPAYSVLELPASQYASFDVYVKNGYESENNAMDEWLKTNQQNYTERLLNGTAHYCVEFYDERFQGEEDNSIVEIWIPVDKVRA